MGVNSEEIAVLCVARTLNIHELRRATTAEEKYRHVGTDPHDNQMIPNFVQLRTTTNGEKTYVLCVGGRAFVRTDDTMNGRTVFCERRVTVITRRT